MPLSLPHHEVLQTVHMVQARASEHCTPKTLTIHSERMRRFSSVIHIRLAPIHSFTPAQWATVSLRRRLFPGKERLWRVKPVTSFGKAWMKATETVTSVHAFYLESVHLRNKREIGNRMKWSKVLDERSSAASHASGRDKLAKFAGCLKNYSPYCEFWAAGMWKKSPIYHMAFNSAIK